MKTSDLSKLEKSLLLYLETCAVDKTGRVESCRMNDDDRDLAGAWNLSGFIQYGRVAAQDLREDRGSNWVRLSDEAWALAAALRRERADRIWASKGFLTTDEKREATAS